MFANKKIWKGEKDNRNYLARVAKKSARQKATKNPGHVTLPFSDHGNSNPRETTGQKIKLRRVVDRGWGCQQRQQDSVFKNFRNPSSSTERTAVSTELAKGGERRRVGRLKERRCGKVEGA